MKLHPSLTGDPTLFFNEKSLELSSTPTNEVDSSIDFQSIMEILRNGVPFTPHTTDQNIKMLSLGVGLEKNENINKFFFKFPFNSSEQEENNYSLEESVEIYHQLLTKSIENKLANSKSPYFLQSAGKDSTSIAIALAELRPGTDCITYLGGVEEDELFSARKIANYLGLKHNSLVSDPKRAYERYLKQIPKLKLITGDFAFLSYFDILGEIAPTGTDTIIDGLGSDVYFGAPLSLKQKFLNSLAINIRIPSSLYSLPFFRNSFKACYAISTLELTQFERFFPGSRFGIDEIAGLFSHSHHINPNLRSDLFMDDFNNISSADSQRAFALAILEAGGAFAKGRFSAHSYGMNVVYPFCDDNLALYVSKLPKAFKYEGGVNKIIVRHHISKHFKHLPYVSSKGSFRFNLTKFAAEAFDQVFHYAELNAETLPGARNWLIKNRLYLNNKFFASKFYLLAIVLPWLYQQQKK